MAEGDADQTNRPWPCRTASRRNLRVGQFAAPWRTGCHHRPQIADAVVEDGVVFSQFVALALLCDDMQKLGPFDLSVALPASGSGIEVVAVDRAVVMESLIPRTAFPERSCP